MPRLTRVLVGLSYSLPVLPSPCFWYSSLWGVGWGGLCQSSSPPPLLRVIRSSDPYFLRVPIAYPTL